MEIPGVLGACGYASGPRWDAWRKDRAYMCPAIHRFRDYKLRAEDMERRRPKLRTCPPSMLPVHRRIMAEHEGKLEAAWDEVAVIESELGAEAASIVAEHYLFCDTWADVAARHGTGVTKAKETAYKALAWLDARED